MAVRGAQGQGRRVAGCCWTAGSKGCRRLDCIARGATHAAHSQTGARSPAAATPQSALWSCFTAVGAMRKTFGRRGPRARSVSVSGEKQEARRANAALQGLLPACDAACPSTSACRPARVAVHHQAGAGARLCGAGHQQQGPQQGEPGAVLEASSERQGRCGRGRLHCSCWRLSTTGC